MNLLDVVGEVAMLGAQIEQTKDEYIIATGKIMVSMSDNPGQLSLTIDYSGEVDAYAQEVYINWDQHNWGNWLSSVANGHDGSAIEGTIVILSAGFAMMSEMILSIQQQLAQAAGEIMIESAMDSAHGDGGHLTGRDAESSSAAIRRRYGTSGQSRFMPASNSRNWNGNPMDRPTSREDFYRRLRAPGLPGLRARFEAGGTDAQMMLAFDYENDFPPPMFIRQNGTGMGRTYVPNHFNWRSIGWNSSGVWMNDPHGITYGRAMRDWNAEITRREREYEPNWVHDRGVPEPSWYQSYNPYTMQRQFENGQFAGPMTWEGNSAPYGTYG